MSKKQAPKKTAAGKTKPQASDVSPEDGDMLSFVDVMADLQARMDKAPDEFNKLKPISEKEFQSQSNEVLTALAAANQRLAQVPDKGKAKILAEIVSLKAKCRKIVEDYVASNMKSTPAPASAKKKAPAKPASKSPPAPAKKATKKK